MQPKPVQYQCKSSAEKPTNLFQSYYFILQLIEMFDALPVIVMANHFRIFIAHFLITLSQVVTVFCEFLVLPETQKISVKIRNMGLNMFSLKNLGLTRRKSVDDFFLHSIGSRTVLASFVLSANRKNESKNQ